VDDLRNNVDSFKCVEGE